MNRLQVMNSAKLDALVNKRAGETKLGETVHTIAANGWQEALKQSPATFVLIGIPEDIGVRANGGIGGAQHLWEPALKAILNVQDTTSLQGNQILVLGAFDFINLLETSAKTDLQGLRELVSEVDDAVSPVIEAITKAGKIPIVVGGGHNNAYPILKGVSKAKGAAIHCINLDAHADYRAIEGRHSGNGFSYARKDGYLDRYSVVGLHRNYNSQTMLDEMDKDNHLQFSFYEDIFLHMKTDLPAAIVEAITFTGGSPTGIELDLDCIEHVLSSAATPSGISTLDARRYLTTCATSADVAYLHITEGTTALGDGREDKMTAKLVAYLVTDFIRSFAAR